MAGAEGWGGLYNVRAGRIVAALVLDCAPERQRPRPADLGADLALARSLRFVVAARAAIAAILGNECREEVSAPTVDRVLGQLRHHCAPARLALVERHLEGAPDRGRRGVGVVRVDDQRRVELVGGA